MRPSNGAGNRARPFHDDADERVPELVDHCSFVRGVRRTAWCLGSPPLALPPVVCLCTRHPNLHPRHAPDKPSSKLAPPGCTFAHCARACARAPRGLRGGKKTAREKLVALTRRPLRSLADRTLGIRYEDATERRADLCSRACTVREMASWNRDSVERLPLAPDGYHPFAFDEEDMMELRSYESAFPRTFSLEAFPSPMDAPQPTHDSNALPVLLSGPPSWTSRVGLTTSFGHVSVVDEPTPPTFSYVPSPPPRPDPHRVRVRAVAPPPAPPRPLPHGAQPAPPPPPPPEWMDDMGDAEDMEQSSVDEEADDGAAARFEPAQDGLETPVVSWTNVVATVVSEEVRVAAPPPPPHTPPMLTRTRKNMGCAINLKELITRTTGAEWRPQKFPAVCLRRTDPKATCLVFASGKCVVTGPQTVAQSQAACRRFVAVYVASFFARHANPSA